MLKNRAIQVSMVKKNPDDVEPLPEDTSADTIALASVAVKDVMTEATKLVVAYVLVDTVRKVIVALVSK